MMNKISLLGLRMKGPSRCVLLITVVSALSLADLKILLGSFLSTSPVKISSVPIELCLNNLCQIPILLLEFHLEQYYCICCGIPRFFNY